MTATDPLNPGALIPYGLGTADVESLTSVVRRLAAREVRAVSDVLREYVIAPDQRQRQTRHPIFQPTRVSEAINGSTPATRLVVARLEFIAGLDLSATTFINHDAGVEFREAFRSVRAWCPACLGDEREAAYDRLIWALAASSVCRRHQLALVDSCGGCARGHRPWHARANPWSCPHCGELLERAPRVVTRGDGESELIASLVARMQTRGAVSVGEVVVTFRALMSATGGLKQLATALAHSSSGLSTVCRGTSRPHLGLYLRALALSEAIAAPHSRGALAKEAWTRRARPPPRRLRYSHLARALRALSHAGAPPSLRAFARAHHVDVATLRARFPQLTGALVLRRAEAGHRRRAAAETALGRRVRATFADLARRGLPSRRELEAALGQPGLFRAPAARRAYRQALEIARAPGSGRPPHFSCQE